MLKRSTVSLVIHAGAGVVLMGVAASALAQVAPLVTQVATPAHADALTQALTLLNPSLGGVVAALVVAVYNKVAAFDARMKSLEETLGARPCMQKACGDAHRRADDNPDEDHRCKRGCHS